MRLLRLLIVALFLVFPAASSACPICLETAAAAPDASRRAQRRSIAVLLLPAMFSMGAIALIVARNRAPGDAA